MSEIKKLDHSESVKIMELPISYVEKGKEIGKSEAFKQVALNMLTKGMPINIIAEVTNLSEEEIQKLKRH